MAHYAIVMADGSVAIMQTVPQPLINKKGTITGFLEPTIEECLAKWHPDEQAKVVSHRPINPARIPTDRTFRDAWKLAGDRIDHNMGKARNIKRNQLRAERAGLLPALDVEQRRALVRKDDAAVQAVEAKLQALRDLPANPLIEAATTVEELKALTLESLTTPKP